MTHIVQNRKMLRWVIGTAVVLSLPLLAMLSRIGVPDPGSGTDGVNWGPFDFVVAGVLLLGTGFLYELATRQAGHVTHRIAVGIAVAAALLLVWVTLAVGMIGSEDNPANLMYVGVLAVLITGVSIARFEPREASIAMFATAITHVVVAAIALIAGLGPKLPADAFFVAAWVASGLLFRRAAAEPAPAA